MASSSFISLLTSKLSSKSKVLGDPTSPDFVASMARWSNLGVKTPFAIVQPATGEDVIKTVREALNAGVPFVPASGGHSPWSTIGKEGIVVDLALYKGVEVYPQRRLATVKGGTLMKDLQSVLHPHKQFTAVGNGSTVGVIPYYLGGGINTPFIGFACKNIVSAKFINAQGELIDVSETENPELLWGIRGAGQFLGLVTELTIKTYPYSILGNDNGQRMCGTYIFLPTQLDAVCSALRKIAESSQYVSSGHCMIVQAPPDMKQQVLLVAPQIFCSAEEAAVFFQPLIEIGPVQQALVPSTFEKHSDHLDWICAEGDFKRFNQIGLPSWSTENFKRLAELHAELIASCPDAVRTGYTLEWHTPCKAERQMKSSFGHENVDCWLNLLSWYTDAANHELVRSMDQKAQAAMRAGTQQDDFISYTNTTREDPLEYRYKEADRIEGLKKLKKEFDPTGVFTKELL
ncbi:FAD-binding domain-containing protein [Annulohypoxylon truncatum]|uniref:FAD-binding domain-containing protein n=1 Tax=Annulohypoxylon truncatum TaxID=327061 RepID=UPI0020085036|nr:FAD-binding domain-containing protein [Annulohypoxylon truncatum]KAI1209079.1 FAD-binding domain-containing protein [Annulohypoxylon truncatum]